VVGLLWKNIKTKKPVSMRVVSAAMASLLWTPEVVGTGAKNIRPEGFKG